MANTPSGPTGTGGNGGDDGEDKKGSKKPIELIPGGKKGRQEGSSQKTPGNPPEDNPEDGEAYVDSLTIRTAVNGGFVLTVAYTDMLPDDIYVIRDREELFAIFAELIR